MKSLQKFIQTLRKPWTLSPRMKQSSEQMVRQAHHPEYNRRTLQAFARKPRVLNPRLFIGKFRYKHLILLLIVVYASFIRLYRLPEMASFDYDQESDSNIVYSIVKEDPIRLLGQELSFQGMFMGPFYYYYLAPFYYATNLHPIGGFVGSVILGLVIIITYYLLGNYLFRGYAGLIAAFFRAVLFYELNNDWSMIPSYACELVVLLTWFTFYKIWKKEKLGKYIPFLFFLFGFYSSVYPILFPFYFVFIYLIVKRKIKIKKGVLARSIIAGLIPLSPLIIFEFRYGFIQSKRLFSIIDAPREGFNLDRLIYFIKINFFEILRILNLDFLPKLISLALIFFVLFVLIKKTVGFWKDDFHKNILFITYIVFILAFNFLPTHVSENYFLPLSTLVILYSGGILSLFFKKLALAVLVIVILTNVFLSNFAKLRLIWQSDNLAKMYHKEMIVKTILETRPKDKSFYVSYITPLGWNRGFDYFFKYYGAMPIKGQPKGYVYTIVFPKVLSYDSIDVSFGSIGLIFPDEITKGIHPYKIK